MIYLYSVTYILQNPQTVIQGAFQKTRVLSFFCHVELPSFFKGFTGMHLNVLCTKHMLLLH